MQKLVVETEAVSQVKKMIIYGNLYSPGQIYGWRIILLLMNPWLITLPDVVACSDKCKQVELHAY